MSSPILLQMSCIFVGNYARISNMLMVLKFKHLHVCINNINIKWLLTANAESVKCLRSQLSKSRSASTSHAPLTNELLHTNNSVTRGIPRFAALLIIMLCYVFDCCSFVSLYTTKTHTYVVNNWLIYVDRYHWGISREVTLL